MSSGPESNGLVPDADVAPLSESLGTDGAGIGWGVRAFMWLVPILSGAVGGWICWNNPSPSNELRPAWHDVVAMPGFFPGLFLEIGLATLVGRLGLSNRQFVDSGLNGLGFGVTGFAFWALVGLVVSVAIARAIVLARRRALGLTGIEHQQTLPGSRRLERSLLWLLILWGSILLTFALMLRNFDPD